MAKTDRDREKAAFMREVGATHATWTTSMDGTETLMSLTLAGTPPPRVPGPAARLVESHTARDPAAEAKRKHDILFAAVTRQPKLVTSESPPSVVPRAVRAKEEAARAEAKRG